MTRKQKRKPVAGSPAPRVARAGTVKLEPDMSIVAGDMDDGWTYQAYGWFWQRGEIEAAFEEKHGFKPERIFRFKLIIVAGPVRRYEKEGFDGEVQHDYHN